MNLVGCSNTVQVAIVGSGPSGFYAAEVLLRRRPDARVDMYDRLPTPFGLIRGGVAPDHPKIKQVSLVYDRIARSPGFAFVGNVEIGSMLTVEQLRSASFADRILDLSEELDAGADAFLDTAAVMSSLDLVISSDTAIAHLAGALGHPAWTALTFSPEWRWLLDRADTPWYPSMRLFRQKTDGDWTAVVQAMAKALQGLA